MSEVSYWWKLTDEVMSQLAQESVHYCAFGTEDQAAKWLESMNADTNGIEPYRLDMCSKEEASEMESYDKAKLEDWSLTAILAQP